MKFSNKIFTLIVCMLIPALAMSAQDEKEAYVDFNRHDIRVTYSDGLTLGGASFWGMGLSDVITGTKRTNQESSGVFGLGYRYAFGKRFRLGLDLGLAKVTCILTSFPDMAPSIKAKELNFLVLPTAELVYFRRDLFQLYGSVSAGLNLTRHYETGLTERGKELAREKSNFDSEIAYQINPIGLRVGSNRIGGFVEAGLGYKGFITAGISLGF